MPTLHGMGRLSRGASADRGAAALEFALVVPVLCILVFGMIDYGLFFTDSLGARDGARVAARQGSVADFTGGCPGATFIADGSDADFNGLACLAVDQTGAIGGNAYARVSAPNGWNVDQNDYVLVCVAIVEDGLTGLTPMPNDSAARSKLRMRVEQPASKTASDLGQARLRSSPAPPANLWDSWCV
jgi:Flp pilus assembly protein TadG